MHIRNLPIFGDCELDGEVALLHLRGLWNQAIPILPHVVQDTLQVRAEIYTLRVTENFKVAHLAAVGSSSQTEIAAVAHASRPASPGSRCPGGFLNRRTC